MRSECGIDSSWVVMTVMSTEVVDEDEASVGYRRRDPVQGEHAAPVSRLVGDDCAGSDVVSEHSAEWWQCECVWLFTERTSSIHGFHGMLRDAVDGHQTLRWRTGERASVGKVEGGRGNT